MFDYILIDSKLLPYVGNVPSNFFDNEFWQTKSLDNCLSDYTITKEKLIKKTLYKEVIEITDFHGIIRFYTSINEIWYQFDAKFTDGELVSITESLNEDHIKRNNKNKKNVFK